jgi:thiosulfate/3-mercaptopyruvate sulfurtransferase
MAGMTHPLIEIKEALALHGKEGVVFVDASYHLPASGRDAATEHQENHIAGARWFDINDIADPKSPLPHTMPKAPVFKHRMQRLGISSDDHLIVYDASPFYSSARAWFMLRYFGHARVQVLNGGFKAWLDVGGPVEAGVCPVENGRFIINDPVGTDGVRSLLAMKKHVETADRQIIDARSAGRFNGNEPEPRQGLAGGHMPGAANIPIGQLIDRETGLIKPVDVLQEIFAVVDPEKPVVTTCGSGVTACGLALGLALVGREDVAIYDGSWSEWGSRSDCPVALD